MSAPRGVVWLDRATRLTDATEAAIEKAIGRRLDRREHRAIARTIVTFRALRVCAQDDASSADVRSELCALTHLPSDDAIADAVRDARDSTIARVDEALHDAGVLLDACGAPRDPTAREVTDAVHRAALRAIARLPSADAIVHALKDVGNATKALVDDELHAAGVLNEPTAREVAYAVRRVAPAQGDPGGRPEAGYRIELADHARELWRLLGFDVRSRYFWWDDVQPRARGVQYKGGRRDNKAPVPRSRSGCVPASPAFAFLVALLGAIDGASVNRRSLAQALRASDARRLRTRRAGN